MNRLFTLLALLLAQMAFGQAHVLHERLSRYYTLAIDDQYGIAAGGATIDNCFPSRLTLFDESATPLWDIFPHTDERLHPIDMIWSNGELAMVGHVGDAQEIVSEPDFWFFARYSPEGEQLQLEIFPGFLPTNPTRLIDRAEGAFNYVVASDSDIFFVTPDLLGEASFDIPAAPRGVQCMDSYIIIQGSNSIVVSTIEQTEPVWEWEDEAVFIWDMLIMDQEIWWVDEEKIHRSDEVGLNMIDIDLPLDADAKLQMAAMGDSILLYGRVEDEQEKGWWINTSTNEITEAFSWDLPRTRVREIQPISSDSAWVIGMGSFSQGFLLKTGFDSFNNTSPYDIGVSNLSITPTEPLNISYDDPVVMLSTRVDAVVEVTNYGMEPVDEFILSSQSFGGFNCSEGRSFHIIQDAALMPGESRTWMFNHFVFLSEIGMIPDIEIRYFTFAPNHQFDNNPENDAFTDIVVDTKEVIAEEATIQLFPNPAIDQIQLNATTAMQSITLLNATGQQVQQHLLEQHAQTFTLARDRLPAGVYWVQVQTKAGMSVKKIVWQ
ncbi:MAG: T9SS type A sorting domain-containing protein [Bacteroidota bacterium]